MFRPVLKNTTFSIVLVPLFIFLFILASTAVLAEPPAAVLKPASSSERVFRRPNRFITFLEKSILNISDVRDLSTGDLDGDGNTDLILFSSLPGLFWTSMGDGKGNFSVPRQHGSRNSKTGKISGDRILIEDFDGDGITDFLYIERRRTGALSKDAPSAGDDEFFLVSSSLDVDGNMKRIFEHPLDNRLWKRRARLVLLSGYVDRDRRKDLILTDPYLNSVSSIVNTPGLWRGSAASLQSDNKKRRRVTRRNLAYRRPPRLLAFDIDNDGFTDIVRVTEHEVFVSRGGVSRGGVLGYFSEPAASLSRPEKTSKRRRFLAGFDPVVMHGHMDRDDFPDLIIRDGSGRAHVLLNKRGRGFMLWRIFDFRADSFVKSGDFNGDGLEDLVVWEEGDHALEVMINSGEGGFLKPIKKPFGVKTIEALFITDVNNDQLDDIIVTLNKNRKGLETKILLNITQKTH